MASLVTGRRIPSTATLAGALVLIVSPVAQAAWRASAPTTGAVARADVLAAPTAFTAVVGSCGNTRRSIALSWTAPVAAPATGQGTVVISRQTTNTVNFGSPLATLDSAATTYTDTTVSHSVTYYYAVRYTWANNWVGAATATVSAIC